MHNILSIIFPIHCYICDEIVATEGCCSKCWKKIDLLNNPKCAKCCFQFQVNFAGLCVKCVNSKSNLDRLIAVAKYNKQTKIMMVRLKNFARLEILNFFLPFIVKDLKEIKIDHIVPVPLHWIRQVWRGYNQAAVIAKAVAEKLNKRYTPYGLERVKFTQPNLKQAYDRRVKVQNAFKATQSFQGQTILLVDDVCTTGATLEESAKALQKAGAKSVIGLTLCKR